LKNIIDNPTTEKFRSLRLSNKIFSQLWSIKGVPEFLRVCGFQECGEFIILLDDINIKYLKECHQKLQDYYFEKVKRTTSFGSYDSYKTVCDYCSLKFKQEIFHCDVCENFEICQNCYEAKIEHANHKSTHHITIKENPIKLWGWGNPAPSAPSPQNKKSFFGRRAGNR